jgi:aryl-alcohol dehydrogenase-like predicted oxidoreductase
MDTVTGSTTPLGRWTIDELLERYISWPEQCYAVRLAYQCWADSGRRERTPAYAPHCSAAMPAVHRRNPDPPPCERGMNMYQTSLNTTQLGETGLEITLLGMGAWAIGGGGWEFGWGPQEDEESIAAIHHALDLGVNWIDTAAAYGFGRSEEIVGRALEGLQDRPYVFTKCSLLEGSDRRVVHSLKRDSILQEAENSVKRLGIDAIDLYQIHWPVPEEDVEEGWAALAELKDQGLVRHIGVSNFNVAQLRRIQQIAPVETLQPQYSLIERDAERELLPFAEREGIGVIVYSPMGSGMLTGGMTRERVESLPDDDWRKHDPRFQEPQLSKHLALVERLEHVAARYDTSPGAVAGAWTLRNPAVDGAIVGFRRPAQVDPILSAANLDLTDQDITEIEGGAR